VKMSRSCLLVLACLAVLCLSKPMHPPSYYPAYLAESQYELLFTEWMVQFGRSYDVEEFFHRYAIFKANLNLIHDHNMYSNQSYTMGTNQFTDLTPAEFKEYVGLRPFPVDNSPTVPSVGHPTDRPLVDLSNSLHKTGPASGDWGLRPNAVTSVKDQGQCGSCYAFASVAIVEGWNGIHGGSGDLSEQEIVDCSGAYSNNGCGAGWVTKSLDYMKDHTVNFLVNYPYVARQQACKNIPGKVRPPGYRSVNGEAGIFDLVSNVGPTAVSIEADHQIFQYYKSGIINDPSCGTTLDHAVTLVAYTPTVWTIKNSWSATWGDHGYVHLSRGNGMCGIGTGTGGLASTVVQ